MAFCGADKGVEGLFDDAVTSILTLCRGCEACRTEIEIASKPKALAKALAKGLG
jgi:hypothetical protein